MVAQHARMPKPNWFYIRIETKLFFRANISFGSVRWLFTRETLLKQLMNRLKATNLNHFQFDYA